MATATKGIILGILIALIGIAASILPPAANPEFRFGLDLLFRLRGPRPAPSEVVLITIDHDSFRHFGIPTKTTKWPRSHHGRLVKKLVNEGARVIVFDIRFDREQDIKQDRFFADAVRDAGNVFLVQSLKNETISLVPGVPPSQAIMQTLTQPIDALADVTAGIAPFPLPKSPASVSQFWTFKRGAGDMPTLPMVAFHHYVMSEYRDFPFLIREMITENTTARLHPTRHFVSLPVERVVKHLRQRFQSDPNSAQALFTRLSAPDRSDRSLLATLIALYRGSDSRYLDHYGPPRSIKTIPYHQVIDQVIDETRGLPMDFTGKAVFVGFSEHLDPKDAFYTAFSKSKSLGVGGVEIMATAFANLLERRSVKPIHPLLNLTVLIAWGVVIGILLMALPGASLVPIALISGAGYLWGAHFAFAHHATWIPIVTPLVLQLPLALLFALLWRYRETRMEREKIRNAIRYYVPTWVVDEMVRSRKAITARGRQRYGICLVTDAEQYTRLAETLMPGELHSMLNRYYQNLFEPVTKHGGFISDVIGDAMLAIWSATTPDRRLRLSACLAALDIVEGIQQIGPATAARLPTRIGLHAGEMVLGSVGAGEHYEFRAVGDVVNSSARIEQLNKQLSTRLLASYEVIEGLEQIVTRDVGEFRLQGKTDSLHIHELVCRRGALTAERQSLHIAFDAGLRLFQAREWRQAERAFETLLTRYSEDGPSRFYAKLCRRYILEPPPSSRDPIVDLNR